MVARVKAGSLAYADLAPQTPGASTEQPQAGTATATPLDLSALKALDADIEVYTEAITVGEATARDVVLAASTAVATEVTSPQGVALRSRTAAERTVRGAVRKRSSEKVSALVAA